MTDETNTQPAKHSKLASFGKYFGLTVLFCAILWGMFFLMGQVLQPKGNSKEAGLLESRAYGFLAEPDNSIDVVFLGDSLASTAFSPMWIWEQSGVTSFVCSVNGEQVTICITMLSDFFKTQSPKVVFLEVEMLYSWIDVGKMFKQFVKDQLTVVEYHHRWKELTLDDFTGKVAYTDISDLKGFNPKAFYEPADTSTYMLPDDSVEKPDFINLMVLRVLQKMCEGNGAQLVLIATPQTRDWNYARHNGMVEISNELGLQFIDMNVEPIRSEVGIDWSIESRDAGIHLNWRGTKKVSAWMANYLPTTYGLTDHRDDPAYAKWDERLARFNERMEDVEKHPEAHDVPGSHMY